MFQDTNLAQSLMDVFLLQCPGIFPKGRNGGAVLLFPQREKAGTLQLGRNLPELQRWWDNAAPQGESSKLLGDKKLLRALWRCSFCTVRQRLPDDWGQLTHSAKYNSVFAVFHWGWNISNGAESTSHFHTRTKFKKTQENNQEAPLNSWSPHSIF